MPSMPLAAFLRSHRPMHLVNADQPVSSSFLDRLRDGQRLALVREGHVVGALVPLEDLQLLELAEHGLVVLEE